VEAQPAPDNADHSAPPVPALQPRESPQQQTELRNKVLQLQQNVKARIAALERTQMANLDRKTLNGARMFVAQSDRALKSGDQQRAFNLARKASLLVDALEQKP
jgi:ferritin